MSAGIILRLILHLITPSKCIFLIDLQFHIDFLIPNFISFCVISVIRHIPLDSIDPSLAIGFFCRDKGLLVILILLVYNSACLRFGLYYLLMMRFPFYHLLLADDFEDFCFRSSKLADESNGAPLFTVAQTSSSFNPISHGDVLADTGDVGGDDSFGIPSMGDMDGSTHEDDWQLL